MAGQPSRRRESFRYLGDYVLTQNDIQAGGPFHDAVCHGGWPMDDHFPEGYRYPHGQTVMHPAPTPYGIPYRCLYSQNVENLFFAGRNVSVTHMALSSTRVMGTCAVMGQAVGTAAALGDPPRDQSPRRLRELAGAAPGSAPGAGPVHPLPPPEELSSDPFGRLLP